MAQLNRSAETGFYTRIGGKLGLRRIHSDEDLALLVRRRLPAGSIKHLIRAGFDAVEIYDLIVPRRTLAHRIAMSQPLSRDESDRAVRAARITALAEQVFGETARAWRWLRKPNLRFEGRAPIEMLATEAGSRLIEESLIQVDDGIFA